MANEDPISAAALIVAGLKESRHRFCRDSAG
jgi:hypothetical protein